MKQFLIADPRGKAIYVGDTVFYKLQPEAQLRAMSIEVDKHGDTYVICEPFRRISVLNCTAIKYSMMISGFQDMTLVRNKTRKK